MGHTYRTEPDPPEEPTASSARDSEEATSALFDGVWIAISSLFGVLFLVLGMMQLTRALSSGTAYGPATAANSFAFFVAIVMFAGVVVWGLRKRPSLERRGAT